MIKSKIEQVGEVLETAGNIADNLTESSEERQDQLTDRHERDMVDGTWLTKNIRPLTLLSLLAYWVVIIPVLHSFGVDFSDSVVNAVEMLSLTAFSFYFGSRGFEKVQLLRTRAELRQQRREDRRNKR